MTSAMPAPIDHSSRRRTLRAWLSVVAAFAVASGLWIWHPSIDDQTPARQSPDAEPFPWQRAPSTVPTSPQAAASAATQSPIVVDAQGRLVATPALRALFDQALTGLGSAPAERQAARQKIERLLDQIRPSASTKADALALFGRYVAYQDGLLELGRRRNDQSPASDWTPSDQLALLDGVEQLQIGRAHV